VIKIYEDNDIDIKDKMIVFSDGLNLEKIQELYERFGDRIQLGFGWGTHLTNDMGVETLSIVMKAVEVIEIDGELINNFLVKLSDNLNKTMGPYKEVELYKKEFGYDNTDSEELIV